MDFFFLILCCFFFEGELLHFNVIVSYTRTQCCVFEYIVLFQVNKIIQADVLKSKRNNKFVCFFLYSSLWFCWAIGEPAKKLKKKRCDKSNCLKFVLPWNYIFCLFDGNIRYTTIDWRLVGYSILLISQGFNLKHIKLT